MLYKIMYKRIQRENIRYYHINNLNLRRKSQKREKTNKNLYNQYDKKSWHYIYMFLFYNICIYYMYPLGVLPSAAWEQRKHELCIVEGVINYMLLWPVVVLKMKVYFSFLICHIVIHVKNFPFPCVGKDDLNNYRIYSYRIGKEEYNSIWGGLIIQNGCNVWWNFGSPTLRRRSVHFHLCEGSCVIVRREHCYCYLEV